MSRLQKAAKSAYAALTTFTNVQEGEDVLIITDESGMEENGEIVQCLFGIAEQIGANPTTVIMKDAKPGASQEFLPVAAKEAMQDTDVLIGITLTTIASVTHHELPDRLRREEQLRSLVMAKRDFETLTSRFALEPDFAEITEIGWKIRREFSQGEEIHVTSENGTDFTMRIDELGRPHGRDDESDTPDRDWKKKMAHEPGGFTTMTWGESGQAPNIGSAEGTAVIDGPMNEFDWPSSPIELKMENGVVTETRGESRVAQRIRDVIAKNENAENLCEISLGTNPIDTDSRDVNIVKKSLGTAHIAIGNGTAYGQDVYSDVHIDMVLMEPTIEVDDTRILTNGEFVL